MSIAFIFHPFLLCSFIYPGYVQGLAILLVFTSSSALQVNHSTFLSSNLGYIDKSMDIQKYLYNLKVFQYNTSIYKNSRLFKQRKFKQSMKVNIVSLVL